jgi:hypothetical protein
MKFTLSILFSLLFLNSFSQVEEEKKPQITYFGMHISPIMPLNLIQNNTVLESLGDTSFEISTQFGHSFGMEIRHDFNNHFSFQTGINYVRRNFNFKVSADTIADYKMKYVGYEIPALFLAYLRLTRNLYMDNSIGVCFNVYPSDIKNEHVYGFYNHWYQMALLGNVGWDLRTKNNGYFFIGGSYHLQLNDAVYFAYFRDKDFVDEQIRVGMKGSYFAVNFKYFFPIRTN